MPLYELVSSKTGRTYQVDFVNEPNEIDVDEAIASLDAEQEAPAAEQPGFGTQLKESFMGGGGLAFGGGRTSLGVLTGDVPGMAAGLSQMQQAQARLQASQTPEDVAFAQDIAQQAQEMAAAEGILPTLREAVDLPLAALRRPGAALRTAVQSLPNVAITTPVTLAGGLAGAALGTAGSPVGSIVGAVATGGAANAAIEVGYALNDLLAERTGGASATMTEEQIAAFLEANPDIVDEAQRIGLTRGATIGAVEALGLKGAGRLTAAPARAAEQAARTAFTTAGGDLATTAAVRQGLAAPAVREAVKTAGREAAAQFSPVARAVGGVGIEAGAAFGGELAAQAAAGQETDFGEAFLETLGEGLAAPASVLGARQVELVRGGVLDQARQVEQAQARAVETAAAAMGDEFPSVEELTAVAGPEAADEVAQAVAAAGSVVPPTELDSGLTDLGTVEGDLLAGLPTRTRVQAPADIEAGLAEVPATEGDVLGLVPQRETLPTPESLPAVEAEAAPAGQQTAIQTPNETEIPEASGLPPVQSQPPVEQAAVNLEEGAVLGRGQGEEEQVGIVPAQPATAAAPAEAAPDAGLRAYEAALSAGLSQREASGVGAAAELSATIKELRSLSPERLRDERVKSYRDGLSRFPNGYSLSGSVASVFFPEGGQEVFIRENEKSQVEAFIKQGKKRNVIATYPNLEAFVDSVYGPISPTREVPTESIPADTRPTSGDVGASSVIPRNANEWNALTERSVELDRVAAEKYRTAKSKPLREALERYSRLPARGLRQYQSETLEGVLQEETDPFMRNAVLRRFARQSTDEQEISMVLDRLEPEMVGLEATRVAGDIARRTDISEELRQRAADKVREIEASISQGDAEMLSALRAVATNKATPEQLASLTQQGLARVVQGQPVITDAGVAMMPAAERPRLTEAERVAEIQQQPQNEPTQRMAPGGLADALGASIEVGPTAGSPLFVRSEPGEPGERAMGEIKALLADTDETYMRAVEAAQRLADTDEEAYMRAMETAQRLVDEAAERAGYNVGPVWHGTVNGGFTVFDVKNPMHFGTKKAADDRVRFWMQEDADDILELGRVPKDKRSRNPRIIRAFLKISNLKRVADVEHQDAWISEASKAKKEGFDGLIYRNDGEDRGSDSYVVFSPEQIKSADPVTYDDQGNVIPLSKRFQTTSPDIRFSTNTPTQDIPQPVCPLTGDAQRNETLARRRRGKAKTPTGLRTIDGGPLQNIKPTTAQATQARTLEAQQVPGAQDTWIGTAEEYLAENPDATFVADNPTLEAFYDPSVDRAVILTDRVQVREGDAVRAARNGTSAGLEAVRRLIRHESFVHRGWRALPQNLKTEFLAISENVVSEDDLDQLAKTYRRFASWRSDPAIRALAVEEWLAQRLERIEKLPPAADSPLAQLLDWAKRVWQWLAGDDGVEPTRAELVDLMRQMVRALETGEREVAERRQSGQTVEVLNRAIPLSKATVVETPDGTQIVGPVMFSLRAFHATPHKVDKFSLEHLGTGEGIQAFGYGLYFAESEKVSGRGGKYDLQFSAKTGRPANIYTVDLLPGREEFLDWDKQLDERSKNVFIKVFDSLDWSFDAQQKAERLRAEGYATGRSEYNALASIIGAENASTRLLAEGIKGISYLDGNSRTAGEGTRNYVIFDGDLVNILEENGQPVEQIRYSLAEPGVVRPSLTDNEAEISRIIEEDRNDFNAAFVPTRARPLAPETSPTSETETRNATEIIKREQIAKTYFPRTKQFAIELVGKLGPMDTWLGTLLNPEWQKQVGLDPRTPLGQYVFAEALSKVSQASVKDRARYADLNDILSRAYQTGGTANATAQAARAAIIEDPRYAGLFAIQAMLDAKRKEQAGVIDPQLGSTEATVAATKAADDQAQQQATEDVDAELRLKDAIYEFGLAAQNPEIQQRIRRVNDNVFRLGVLARLREQMRARAEQASFISLSASAVEAEYAAMSVEQMDAEMARLEQELQSDIAAIEGERAKARTTPRGTAKTVVEQAKDLIEKLEAAPAVKKTPKPNPVRDLYKAHLKQPMAEGDLVRAVVALGVPEADAAKLYELASVKIAAAEAVAAQKQAEREARQGDKPTPAEAFATRTINEVANRLADPAATPAEKEQKALPIRELYKEHVRNGLPLDVFIERALTAGIDEQTAFILHGVGSMERDAAQTRRGYIEAGAAQRFAEGVVNEAAERFADPALPQPVRNKRKNAIRELYRNHIKEPMPFDTFVEMARKLGVDERTAAAMHGVGTMENEAKAIQADARRQEIDARKLADRTARLLDTDKNSLENLINKLRPKITGGLNWREMFDRPLANQREWRQQLFDTLRADPALANLTPQEVRDLAAELDRIWNAKREAAFKALAKRMNLPGAREGVKEKIAESAPALLRYINSGAFNDVNFRNAVSDKFGIPPLSEQTVNQVTELMQKAQADGITQVERNKYMVQAIRLMQQDLRVERAEIFSNYWVTSVLSGFATLFDMALSVMNGARVMTQFSADAIIRRGDFKLAGRAAKNYFQSLGNAILESSYYFVSGDPSMLDNYQFTLNTYLREGSAAANPFDYFERITRDPNRASWTKVIPYYFAGLQRLMTAFDHINSTSTAQGTLEHALAYNKELYSDARMPSAEDIAAARAQAVELAGGDRTYAQKRKVTAYTRQILNERLDRDYPGILDEAKDIGRIAAYQNDPSGIGGLIYHTLLGITNKAVAAAGTFRDEGRAKAEAQSATDKFMREFLYAVAVNSRNLTGTRFVRFVGNRVNELMSFTPGVGLLRLTEKNMTPTKRMMLMQNQVVGALLSMWVVATVLRMIDDVEDDEERKFRVFGSWQGLSPDQKNQLRANNAIPNSLQFWDGEKWVSFNYVAWPVASLLATVGNLSDMKKFKPEDWSEKALFQRLSAAAWSGVFSFKDLSALSGFMDLLGASTYSSDPVDSAIKWAAKTAANFGGGLIPRMVKDIDLIMQPEARKAGNPSEYFIKEIPFYRRTEAAGEKLYNVFGENVTLNRMPWRRAVTAGPVEKEYQLLNEMNNRGLFLGTANPENRTVGYGASRRDLTKDEAERYMIETGKRYKQFVLDYGERLLTMSDEQAKQFISRRTEAIRNAALRDAIR